MNLFDINNLLPLDSEVINTIVDNNSVKIERIVSSGQSSPDNFWYDQIQDEWVVILEGYGVIEYPDKSTIHLHKGDSLLIPAHTKHRVQETADPTIWLTFFFNNSILNKQTGEEI